MFSSTGIINYDTIQGYRLTVEVDHSLSDYYRALMPKYLRVNKPRYAPHITVVNAKHETPVNLEPWGKYQGERIEFFYEIGVEYGKNYYWLNVLCKRLEDIRIELGMTAKSRFTVPPVGFSKYFHCTIANAKQI